MSVPFNKIGPGQSARLAWQVMGCDGPVFNPSGIRYLAPGDPVLPAVNAAPTGGALMNASVALAGVNLLVSAGTLVLVAATLAEVKKANAKLDQVLTRQALADTKLAAILAKLDRIDVKVSESRLATLVAHACTLAAQGDDEIAFGPFADLADDLTAFIKDSRIVRGMPSGVRLGSDVRASLTWVVTVLRGVRMVIAAAHNHATGPEKAWQCHAVNDYWPTSTLYADVLVDQAVRDQVHVWDTASYLMHLGVDAQFSFNTAADHDALQDRVDAVLLNLFDRYGVGEDEARARIEGARAAALRQCPVPNNGNRWLHLPYSDAYGLEVARLLRDASYVAPDNETTLPPAVIDAAGASENLAATIEEFAEWWLYRTDAGLVYRAYVECSAIGDGYAGAFDRGACLSASASRLDAGGLIVEVDVGAALSASA